MKRLLRLIQPDSGYSCLCLLTVLLFSGVSAYSQTHQDTIFLKNNDRIVGEIKELVNGVLTMEPDYGDDDFKITWLDVTVLRSTQYFLLTMDDGTRINGTLRTQEQDSSKVTLYTLEGKSVVALNKIVYMRPIESNIISRLEAAVSVGLNFTKSNNLRQLTVIGSLSYSARAWAADASINTISNSQEDAESTRRTDASLGAVYFLKKDWFTELNGEVLTNDEQQLDLRFTMRGVAGKYIIHSNRMYFKWSAGLAWNNEQFNDEENTSRNSMEGVLGLRFNSFDYGDFKVFTSLYIYPSITESDRVRADFKADLRYNLPKDFFVKLGYTLNFDSQPVEEAARDDYILQATFGWALD